MSDSMNLITAQISFLDSRLSLIHIPITHYSFFLQPILRLLFGEDHDEDASKIPWTSRHQFLNVSITPVECSVFCSRELADRFFRPLVEIFNSLTRSKQKNEVRDVVEINPEDYIVVQVDGQGLEPGQRVLELTSPLAMAGISIFFVTTYFSDYILVPARARHTVTKALEQRGFVFLKSADAFVSKLSPSSPPLSHQSHARQQSSSSGLDSSPGPPTTPPAKSIPELQTRTFTRLKRSNIVPAVDRTIRLMSCAGHKDSASDAALEAQLRDDLLQVLLATCPDGGNSRANRSAPSPTKNGLHIHNGGFQSLSLQEHDQESPPDLSTRFLSLTLTDSEPISVLFEHTLLPVLGRSLLGARTHDDILVPITLDLRDLPLEATGIVCGVAGRLAQGAGAGNGNGNGTTRKQEEPLSPRSTSPAAPRSNEQTEVAEISFLSTARAGTVIVRESELERAVRALEQGAAEVN